MNFPHSVPFPTQPTNWLHSVFAWFPAALVSIEVAIVGLIVAWQQLRYMQRRDRKLDLRNAWAETHKLMMTFRFRRGLLEMASGTVAEIKAVAEHALEALHNLKGQLDRMPGSALVTNMAEFLHSNWQAEKWRSPDFTEKFDEYAKQAALRSR